MKLAILLGLTVGVAGAQTVQVYSEFVQITDAGKVLAPESPREILSPAVARNAFSSFQLAIRVPSGTKFVVYVGQNPESAVKVTLYRRTGMKLQSVELPYEGKSAQVLWMDLWVDANAPVRRVKIEPQVGIDGEWVTYPMEMRVMEAVVPKAILDANDMTPFEIMRLFLCRGFNFTVTDLGFGVPILQSRNALQDTALAAAGSAPLREEMKKAMGGCNAKSPANPEFYLRLRDYFFTPLWEKVR